MYVATARSLFRRLHTRSMPIQIYELSGEVDLSAEGFVPTLIGIADVANTCIVAGVADVAGVTNECWMSEWVE
jgi:hypothetical protein